MSFCGMGKCRIVFPLVDLGFKNDFSTFFSKADLLLKWIDSLTIFVINFIIRPNYFPAYFLLLHSSSCETIPSSRINVRYFDIVLCDGWRLSITILITDNCVRSALSSIFELWSSFRSNKSGILISFIAWDAILELVSASLWSSLK